MQSRDFLESVVDKGNIRLILCIGVIVIGICSRTTIDKEFVRSRRHKTGRMSYGKIVHYFCRTLEDRISYYIEFTERSRRIDTDFGLSTRCSKYNFTSITSSPKTSKSRLIGNNECIICCIIHYT